MPPCDVVLAPAEADRLLAIAYREPPIGSAFHTRNVAGTLELVRAMPWQASPFVEAREHGTVRLAAASVQVCAIRPEGDRDDDARDIAPCHLPWERRTHIQPHRAQGVELALTAVVDATVRHWSSIWRYEPRRDGFLFGRSGGVASLQLEDTGDQIDSQDIACSSRSEGKPSPQASDSANRGHMTPRSSNRGHMTPPAARAGT